MNTKHKPAEPVGAELLRKRMRAALEAGNVRRYRALRRAWLARILRELAGQKK